MGKPLLHYALLAVLLVMTAVTGCKSMAPASAGAAEDDDPSLLPWNAPASWEGKTLGIPY